MNSLRPTFRQMEAASDRYGTLSLKALGATAFNGAVTVACWALGAPGLATVIAGSLTTLTGAAAGLWWGKSAKVDEEISDRFVD